MDQWKTQQSLMDDHWDFSEEWNNDIPQEIPSMPTYVSWRVSKTPGSRADGSSKTSSFILSEVCILSTKAASPVFCTFLQSHEASALGCSHACFDLLDNFPFWAAAFHQLFHLEKVRILGSIYTALEKRQLILLSYPVAAISNSETMVIFQII